MKLSLGIILSLSFISVSGLASDILSKGITCSVQAVRGKTSRWVDDGGDGYGSVSPKEYSETQFTLQPSPSGNGNFDLKAMENFSVLKTVTPYPHGFELYAPTSLVLKDTMDQIKRDIDGGNLESIKVVNFEVSGLVAKFNSKLEKLVLQKDHTKITFFFRRQEAFIETNLSEAGGGMRLKLEIKNSVSVDVIPGLFSAGGFLALHAKVFSSDVTQEVSTCLKLN